MPKALHVAAGALVIFITLSPAAALADQCDGGNACNDVLFEFKDGCYHTTNLGSRRVHVTRGPYSFDLQRTQTHILHIGGRCVQSYVGQNTANYI